MYAAQYIITLRIKNGFKYYKSRIAARKHIWPTSMADPA